MVLPHTLELNPDPHATLREVERVLVPEGKVVICCLNPASLWGLRQRRAHLYRRLGFGQLYLPDAGEFIGYRRLRDWLRLLNFEVETGSFGCYRPAMTTEHWLERFDWMDRRGRALVADLRRRLFHRRHQAGARHQAGGQAVEAGQGARHGAGAAGQPAAAAGTHTQEKF